MTAEIVLGLNLGHDVAVALMSESELLVSAEAERVLDVKHARGPGVLSAAATAALRTAGVHPKQVAAVVIADGGRGALEAVRAGVTEHTHSGSLLFPLGTLHRLNLGAPLPPIQGLIPDVPTFLACHHASHAAAAIYLSGYDDCVALVADGFGSCCATIAYVYRSGRLIRLEHTRDQFLLGHRYRQFARLVREIDPATDRLDLAGKLMGLHAGGSARAGAVEAFDRWFRIPFGDSATADRHLEQLLGCPPSVGCASALDPQFLDLAASMQEAFSRLMESLAAQALAEVDADSIVLSGGCSLNVLANSRIAALPAARRFFVQPNAGDGGVALGAAVLASAALSGRPIHHPDGDAANRASPFLGVDLIDDMIDFRGDAEIEMLSADATLPGTIEAMMEHLVRRRMIGIVTGRAEVGPRALGHRSILACANDPHMRETLNGLKRREWWRPFAPVCRQSDAERYFEARVFSPYMMTTAKTKPAYRRALSSATHDDGTARLQVLPSRDHHPLLWDLLTLLERTTGVGVLINTSFNLGGKPLLNRASTALEIVRKTVLHGAWIEGRLYLKRGLSSNPGPQMAPSDLLQ